MRPCVDCTVMIEVSRTGVKSERCESCKADRQRMLKAERARKQRLENSPGLDRSPSKSSIGWSQDRIDKLTELWNADELSAEQIAIRLGGVTRQAIIGKARRLGLKQKGPSRKPGQRRTEKQRAATRAFAKRVPITKVLGHVVRPPVANPTAGSLKVVAEWAESEITDGISILDHKEGQCRWPHDDASKCCGKRVNPGLPYCSFHAQRAYRPAQERRRKSVRKVA